MKIVAWLGFVFTLPMLVAMLEGTSSKIRDLLNPPIYPAFEGSAIYYLLLFFIPFVL
jgi:hypothetical protein